jgi:AcrR family transcriptional regulator
MSRTSRPSNSDLRERILAATRRCLALYGAPKTGIADVASEAGLSRQSIYTHFGTRSNLIGMALGEAGEEFSDRVSAHLSDLPGSPRDLVVEAILFVLRELPQDPLLRVVSSLERERGRDALVLDFSRSMTREISRQALAPVQARCGEASDDDFEILADLMLRLTLSLFVIPLPQGQTEEQVRAALERWFTASEWLR